jgi:ferredoxin
MLHKISCVPCILCSTSEGDLVPVGKKGIESLKHAAVCRSENDRCIHFNDGIFVH